MEHPELQTLPPLPPQPENCDSATLVDGELSPDGRITIRLSIANPIIAKTEDGILVATLELDVVEMFNVVKELHSVASHLLKEREKQNRGR